MYVENKTFVVRTGSSVIISVFFLLNLPRNRVLTARDVRRNR